MKCLCILVIAFFMIPDSSGSMDHRGPKGHFESTKCCKVEKTAAQTDFIEKMTKFAEECQQELGPPEVKRRCMHECLATKTNIINADKSINVDEYRNFVTNQMAVQDFQKAAAQDIVTKCIEMLQKPEVENPDDASPSGCSNNAKRAFKCAAKGMFNSCPTELQDTSDKCAKLREMMNSGKMQKHGEEPFDGRDDD